MSSQKQFRITIPRVALIPIAVAAGAMSVFGFAPYNWRPLTLISFCILFGLWYCHDRRRAAEYGFAYGLGMFGVGTSWMHISLHEFGGMPPLLAAFCILVLTMVVALFPAAAGYLQGRVTTRSPVARFLLIMPAMYFLLEWLRGWIFSGYPWLTSGYVLLGTPMDGFAPLGGVYLLSILALTIAGGFALLHTRNGLTPPMIFLWVGLVALNMGGGWLLSKVEWSRPAGDAVSLAIVQNNVRLSLKWDQAKNDAIVADYIAQSALHRDVDLVVWPEAAVPQYLDRMPPEFLQQLQSHPADFVFGVLTRDGERVYNSIASVGEATAFYHKQHLVPFGEFLPLRWLFAPLMRMLNIPMSDFTAFDAPQQPLPAAGMLFAASICYEDAFPDEWRAQVPAAGALLNLSEDAWFGDSLAPHQRLQMARLRALEFARPMLRASNNGLSSLIDYRGDAVALAPQFVRDVITAELQPRVGDTPYTRFGNAPVLGLVLAMLAAGVWVGRRAGYFSNARE